MQVLKFSNAANAIYENLTTPITITYYNLAGRVRIKETIVTETVIINWLGQK